MPDIYDQHDKAFAQVSAYVIAKDGARVATVAFKYPRDGAGRLYAYVHWHGMPMTRGFADGYGYDKASAAACSAVRGVPRDLPEGYDSAQADYSLFLEALSKDAGYTWDRELEKRGFSVWQAV